MVLAQVLAPDAFDLRDAMNPSVEARLPHPCNERLRVEHAGAPFDACWLVKQALLALKPGRTCPTGLPVGDQTIPSSPQIASTRAFTAADISIGRPHSRLVSPGHLFVASKPTLPPSPETGEAKSR